MNNIRNLYKDLKPLIIESRKLELKLRDEFYYINNVDDYLKWCENYLKVFGKIKKVLEKTETDVAMEELLIIRPKTHQKILIEIKRMAETLDHINKKMVRLLNKRLIRSVKC